MDLPLPQHNECVAELEQIANELESLTSKILVHKKKFDLIVSQTRQFIIEFSKKNSSMNLSIPQLDAYRCFCASLNDLRQLLVQYQPHSWSQPTAENEISGIPSELCLLCTNLRNKSSILCERGSKYFDDESPLWVQFHIIDLNGIQASFNRYIKTARKDDPAFNLIKKRLQSIDDFLKEYGENDVSPGVRVFSPMPVHYQSWRMLHTDLKEVRIIGDGVSANVFYGFDSRNGNEVAIKKLKFPKLSGPKLTAFQREISVLATTSHPCLLKFIGATDTHPFCIVTEWMGGGTLYNEIHEGKKLNPTQKTIAAYDIARGMQYLHSRHILHRDLKSLNVLFDNEGRAKICDFGFSRHMADNDMMTQNVGTPHWMAPELLISTGNYSYKVDVYSYGIVLWEIVSGNAPFKGLDPTQIVAQVLTYNLRPSIPESVNLPLKSLITRCWDRIPDRRPSFDEIVRLFQTGQILIDGSDKKEFLEYATNNGGKEVAAYIRIQSDLESLNNGGDVSALIEAILSNGIPTELLGKCWNIFESMIVVKPSLISKISPMFLSTQYRQKTSQLLRSLPPDSIPQEIAFRIVEIIPTGSEDVDENLFMIACKNNAADAAAVYATVGIHTKIALEVCSRKGASSQLRIAVADRCVQCLASNDESMICTALRCLISLGEYKRISPQFVNSKIASATGPLLHCLSLSISLLASNGIQFNENTLLFLLNSENNSPESCALLSCCKDMSMANIIISLICKPTLLSANAMKAILKNNSLRESLKKKYQELSFDECSEQVLSAFESISRILFV